MLRNTSSSWSHGSYEEDRNYQIKIIENRSLYDSKEGKQEGVVIVGGNITIAYGWDIDVNSYLRTKDALKLEVLY